MENRSRRVGLGRGLDVRHPKLFLQRLQKKGKPEINQDVRMNFAVEIATAGYIWCRSFESMGGETAISNSWEL